MDAPQSNHHLIEIHGAMLRARALGFDETADAMQKVLDELVASELKTAPDPDRGPAPAEGTPCTTKTSI